MYIAYRDVEKSAFLHQNQLVDARLFSSSRRV